MFERLKKWMGKTADAIRRVAGIKPTPPVEHFDVAPLRTRRPPVKAMIPPSSFTKTGPGVRARLRAALVRMTRGERLIARARGWARDLVREDGGMRD